MKGCAGLASFLGEGEELIQNSLVENRSLVVLRNGQV